VTLAESINALIDGLGNKDNAPVLKSMFGISKRTKPKFWRVLEGDREAARRFLEDLESVAYNALEILEGNQR
jgi:hypothetical protein